MAYIEARITEIVNSLEPGSVGLQIDVQFSPAAMARMIQLKKQAEA